MRNQLLALLCLVVSAATLPAVSQAASFTGLGFPQGDSFSDAFAASADGSVVVGFFSPPSSEVGQAFRWTAGGGMVGLGFLPGAIESSADHVSADGSVVVGSSFDNTSPIGQTFRWTAGEGMVGLGFLPGATDSFASGVSADGSVIVGESGGQAFRWTAGGGMIGLGFLPGATDSFVSGVSADGSVVVGGSGGQAFRWTAGGGMVGLGFLAGETSSFASGVSADGSVVVGSSFNTSLIHQAFRWTAGEGMVGLGFLPGATDSTPSGVSANGSVVVGESGGQAFRWTASEGMVSISGNSCLFSDSSVSGVSADGSVVAGTCFARPPGASIWDPILGWRNLTDVLVNDPDIGGWSIDLPRGISADGSTIFGTGLSPGPVVASDGWIIVIPRPKVQIEVEPFIPKDPVILTSRLPIAVAVLGSNTVDVTQIDATTLRFGPKGATPVFTQAVSVGGQMDLVALFRVQETGFAVGDKQACLLGAIGGEFFRSCDGVIVIMTRGCGLGFELAPILPALLWLRNRRRRNLA